MFHHKADMDVKLCVKLYVSVDDILQMRRPIYSVVADTIIENSNQKARKRAHSAQQQPQGTEPSPQTSRPNIERVLAVGNIGPHVNSTFLVKLDSVIGDSSVTLMLRDHTTGNIELGGALSQPQKERTRPFDTHTLEVVIPPQDANLVKDS